MSPEQQFDLFAGQFEPQYPAKPAQQQLVAGGSARGGLATIQASTSAGFADLRCIGCGTRRGQISQRTAEFLSGIVAKFGSPSEIIFRRDPHALPAPPGTTAGKAGNTWR